MAGDKVTIKLEVNADTAGARKVQRELNKIAAQTSALNSASGMRSSTRTLETLLSVQGQKWRKHFDEVDKLIKGFGTGLLVTMKLLVKGVIAEFALLSLSMVGVHALFKAGEKIMQAYRWSIDATGAAAAQMAVAITTAAAAIREQQAAMFAYKGTGMKEFGSGLNQTRVLMRGLSMDAEMAFIGVENLNKAFAAVSKTSTFTSGSQSLLKGLMDFAAAGQPIEQGVEKVGELVAVLQDTKSTFAQIKKSAEASSPAMKKALEEAEKSGIKTKKAFIDAINSGQLSELGGVTGQFDAVSGTLMNRIKQNFNMLRGQLADAGQNFLAPIKDSLSEVFKIIQRAFTRTIPLMSSKGLKDTTSNIIKIAEKLENIYVKVIYAYGKRTEGLFQNISKWWNNFRSGWDDVANALRPLIDGARVIEDAFRAAMQPIKDAISDKFGSFNQWVQDNRDEVLDFGDRVGKLIASIMEAIGRLGDMYKTLLPFINRVVTGLTEVTNLLGKMFGMFSGSEFGSMFALMGLRQLKQRGSRFAGGQLELQGNDMAITRLLDENGLTPAQRRLVDNEPYGTNFDDDGLRSRTGEVNPFPIGPMAGTRTSTGDDPFAGATFIDGDDPFATTPAEPERRRGGRFIRNIEERADRRFRRFMGEDFMTDDDIAHEEARRARRGGRGGWFSDKMSDFTTPMTVEEIKKLETAQKRPGLIGRSGMAQALRRQRARNVGLDRFQRSGTAQMGVGMGLGMLSSVAPKEMQGALALGGMAAQINPLLGLAVAGVGGAFNAQSAGMGALAGMGGGAAIGAMVGGPVGAIIGAALGGVAGAIRGWKNKSNKEAEAAKKAVQQTLNQTTAGIVSNVAKNLAEQGGRFGAMPIKQGLQQVGSSARDSLAAMRSQMVQTSHGPMFTAEKQQDGKVIRSAANVARDALDAYLNSLAARGQVVDKEFLKEMRKSQMSAATNLFSKLEGIEKAEIFMSDMFTERMSQLTNVTGKSESQVLALAKSLGVDLMNPMKSTIELTKELGHLQLRTAQEISQAYGTLAGDVQKIFNKAVAALDAPDVIDEATRSLSDLIDSGGAKDRDVLQFMENVVPQILSYYGENSGAALAQLVTSFGAGGELGTAFTDPNSPLFGRQAAFETAEVRDVMAEAMEHLADGFATELIQDINANLATSGQTIQNTDKFKDIISEISITNPELLGQFALAQADNFKMFDGSGIEFFRNQGIDIAITELEKSLRGTEPSQVGLDKETKNQITELSKQFGEIFKKYVDKPEWMTEAFIRNAAAGLDDDTSTPRGSRVGDTTSSRLATTMNRHSVMDSMLTGKRTITSAWRNTNLGSMNSDHVTGRAYDLTGQNLGQYQSLVNGTGGFAEFHGVNGARHLHVVPGPVGDTSVPSMTAVGPTRSSSNGTVTNNYNVNVSTNASDPEAVATFVMRKIEEVNRDSRERR
jgi:hypothetical protein